MAGRDSKGRFVRGAGGGGGPKAKWSMKFLGLDKFVKALNRIRFRAELRSKFGREVKHQLELVRGDIIRYIRSETHGVPNSLLTILGKGSSKPLVDRGDLFNSPTVVVKATSQGIEGGVGVLRSARSSSGESLVNVAKALHDGFVVQATPKVRAAIMAKVRERAQRRGQAMPHLTGPAVSHYRIKGRPFVRVPFELAERRIKEALGGAMNLVIQGL